MVTIVDALADMIQLLSQAKIPEPTPTIRLQAGLLLRKSKELWSTVLLAAAVTLLRKAETPASHQPPSDALSIPQRVHQWHSLIVNDLQLDQCWTIKPMLNGKQIIQCLGLNNGPQVGMYTQELMEWMLTNPKGTIEDATEFLKNRQRQRELEENQAAQHISKKMHL